MPDLAIFGCLQIFFGLNVSMLLVLLVRAIFLSVLFMRLIGGLCGERVLLATNASKLKRRRKEIFSNETNCWILHQVVWPN